MYRPERWQAVDAAGQVAFDVIVSDTDSGAVYVAGTTRLVGLIVQFGFTCTDLEAWERLAAAEAPADTTLQGVDFSLGEEAGPTVWTLSAEERDALLEGASVDSSLGDGCEVGSAWRGLRVVVAPWDADGVITRLLTATSDVVLPRVNGLTGAPLAHYPAAAAERIAAALRAVPPDAVEQRRDALGAAIAEPDFRDETWLRDRLARLREVVTRAVEHHAELLVRVL